ncbi:hypothetical protein [Luteirhabdus pelagi]|uniref:hypothetical protein n=1 Tax=Luteirhabdus pelagi TaxID=2792783 RepID=UPI001939BCA1|nr:hypothetical protein [Luteirhabdus pelagi]
MKPFFVLFCFTALMLSCDSKRRETTVIEPIKDSVTSTHPLNLKKTDIDTIHNYWQLDVDTITERKEFSFLDENYILTLKTYSLNDSSVIRRLGRNDSPVYMEYAHNVITDIELASDTLINRKRIDKAHFKDFVDPEFYRICTLFSTEIDSINKKTVYMSSQLTVPDTGNHWEISYLFYIRDYKVGTFEIKNTEYIGL